MSIDMKMAWRNVWRNPRRTGLTVSAIAFAGMLLVFMLSFQLGSYETMINAAVMVQTGHLQVQAEGYQENQSIRKVVPHPEKIGEILSGIPEVAAWTCRTSAFSLVSSEDRTYGALVVGIDPEREARTSTLEKLIREGAYLADSDTNQALVGKLLARNLHVGIGDEITVLGQGRDGSVAATVVTVKGIYSSGQDAFDRTAIHVPLPFFQEVYFMRDAVHRVVVLAQSLGKVGEIERKVEAALAEKEPVRPLAVLGWQELMPGLRQAITVDLIGGFIFWFLLVLVVAFSILNTFLMAIFERTREFGVMMAMGTTPGRLTKLLLIESLFMTMVGIVLGILLGCGVTLFFESYGIDVGGASEMLKQYGISGRMYPRLSVISALTGPGLVLVITFLAALYPALKVRRLKPVEALSFV